MARRKPKHIRVEEKKKMHIAIKITLIILAVIFLLILSLFLYINAKLDLIEYDDEIDKSVYDTVDLENGDSILDEDELIEDEEPVVDPETEVVEDIVDSGRTLSYLLALLKDRKPNSLKLCTLLDKPDRRVIDVDVDYTGFAIPDEFVVGYGLDYAQKYRNLPYIGVAHLDEE